MIEMKIIYFKVQESLSVMAKHQLKMLNFMHQNTVVYLQESQFGNVHLN